MRPETVRYQLGIYCAIVVHDGQKSALQPRLELLTNGSIFYANT